MTGANYAKTFILIAVMTALFGFVGLIVGGEAGMLIALSVAGAMNLFAYWNSDKMVLRMHGAKPVGAASAPEFHRVVRQLADRAGLPMPKVYIMQNDQPNAFATGRNPENAAVAATTGLLSRLNAQEVAGVMAHELAHVKNRDTLTMTITATIAGAVGMLANFAMFAGMFGRNNNNPMGLIGTLALALLAPMAAGIVQMAISRSREYEADRIGAQICGNPIWLASALRKIDDFARGIDNHVAERNPATAHMFIVNPLHAHKADSLFSTHPSTANRVARLQRMAGAVSGGPRPASAGARRGRSNVPNNSGRPRRSGPWG